MGKSLERFYQSIMHKEPDQVPVYIVSSEPTYATFCGIKLIELYKDPAKMLKCQLSFIKRFPNALFSILNLWPRLSGPGDGITTAFGAELVWSENNAPWTKPIIKDPKDIDNLKTPDPYKDGRLPIQLEGLRYYMEKVPIEIREKYGLLDNNAYCPGGVEYAALLIGYDKFLLGFHKYPEKIHKLIEIITDLSIDYVKAQEKIVGKITKIFLSDHSATFMSRKEFETFCVPYLKKITNAFKNAIIIYHNEGNVKHLIDLIPKIGIDCWHLGENIDLLNTKKIIGDKICLIGNIDPINIMLRGDPEKVDEACKDAIKKAAHNGGYILAPGGGFVANTPPENIDAMIKAAEKYGKYPILG
ncbi:MAG: uroporphyrinogen decarboxylase family protein [Candidatus Aenigmatarchaeota archaeon]